MRNQKKLLEELYLENKLSTREIASQFGVHNMTILDWLRRFDIPRRTISEANAGQGWKGGKKYYWHKQACKVWEEYWHKKRPNGYVIHHIDKDITNNDICNLALLTTAYHGYLHHKNNFSHAHPGNKTGNRRKRQCV